MGKNKTDWESLLPLKYGTLRLLAFLVVDLCLVVLAVSLLRFRIRLSGGYYGALWGLFNGGVAMTISRFICLPWSVSAEDYIKKWWTNNIKVNWEVWHRGEDGIRPYYRGAQVRDDNCWFPKDRPSDTCTIALPMGSWRRKGMVFNREGWLERSWSVRRTRCDGPDGMELRVTDRGGATLNLQTFQFLHLLETWHSHYLTGPDSWTDLLRVLGDEAAKSGNLRKQRDEQELIAKSAIGLIWDTIWTLVETKRLDRFRSKDGKTIRENLTARYLGLGTLPGADQRNFRRMLPGERPSEIQK